MVYKGTFKKYDYYWSIIEMEDKHEIKMNTLSFRSKNPGVYLREGMKLEFEIGRDGSDRHAAINVKVVNDTRTRQTGYTNNTFRRENTPEVLPQRNTNIREADNNSHFLNPYNFVSYSDKSIEEGDFSKKEPLKHGIRADLKSGRISCELKVKTPLAVCGDKIDERSFLYKTFELGGKPYIPGSSLKGMIRSIYEAVTNSCFSVMNKDEMLFRRMEMGRGSESENVYPVRIDAVSEEEITISIFKGRKIDFNRKKGMLEQKHYNISYANRENLTAAWINQYDTIKGYNNNRGNRPGKSNLRVNIDNFRHGEEVKAIIEPAIHDPYNRRLGRNEFKFFYWKVVKVYDITESDETISAEPIFDKSKHLIVKGFIFITGQNMENKHDEKLFFGDIIPKKLNLRNESHKKIVDNYNLILKSYYDIHEKDLNDRNGEKMYPIRSGDKYLPALSHYMWNNAKEHSLQKGELLYAKYEGKDEDANENIKFLVPVQSSRFPYANNPYSLLDDNHKQCTDYNKLCPACRVFGWVNPEANTENELKQSAISGLLSFSGAKTSPGKFKLMDYDITIPELSSPKPTTTFFYLKDKNNRTIFIRKRDGYNPNRHLLRGRKFYLYHENTPEEFTWLNRNENKNIPLNDRNRAIRNIVQPGSIFTFDIEFKNLSEIELGILIWCLELEDGMYHRLGYGKPLGLGSIKLNVKNIELLDIEKKYCGFNNSGLSYVYRNFSNEELKDIEAQKEYEENKKKFVESFKEELTKLYGDDSHDFQSITHIKELIAILSRHGLQIEYPRRKNKKGENFEWFVEAAKSDQNIQLNYPEDINGLPYL